MSSPLTPTDTTFVLRSKLPSQRKYRTFAEYVVSVHASGLVTADVSYFNYRTGCREQGFQVPAASVASQVAKWLASAPHNSVAYYHYEASV